MIASNEIGVKARVLIVDDDEMITGALLQGLEGAGLVVDVATDPATALSLLDQRRYGLIVLDTYMTGQLHERASDLLDKVRRLRGRAHLVVLTGYGARQMTQRLIEENDVTVVRKPMPINVLIALVSALVPTHEETTSRRSIA